MRKNKNKKLFLHSERLMALAVARLPDVVGGVDEPASVVVCPMPYPSPPTTIDTKLKMR